MFVIEGALDQSSLGKERFVVAKEHSSSVSSRFSNVNAPSSDAKEMVVSVKNPCVEAKNTFAMRSAR
jgi:hypothetical protein